MWLIPSWTRINRFFISIYEMMAHKTAPVTFRNSVCSLIKCYIVLYDLIFSAVDFTWYYHPEVYCKVMEQERREDWEETSRRGYLNYYFVYIIKLMMPFPFFS